MLMRSARKKRNDKIKERVRTYRQNRNISASRNEDTEGNDIVEERQVVMKHRIGM